MPYLRVGDTEYGKQPKPTAEYVGGFRDGERTDLIQGSPLRVARMRDGVVVYDAYRLAQTAAGFIYRHEGETDCEDE